MATEHTDPAKKLDGIKSSTSHAGSSIGELVAKITSQFSALVRDEIKYTGLQAKTKVKQLGAGGVLFAIAGVLALYMLGFLFAGIAWAFAELVPVWAGYLITAGIILLVILILALLGKRSLTKASQAKIAPKDGLAKNVEAIKKGFDK
ncbi:phage holin family protein [Arcanobacterium buesumense]|uniref:Phage holin family protein n=1 Tax=Arcanobacterium buesumense TaxID=2722751 RepID=A0A6H2EKQ2_9ACTO|nr:phage holin family protein [Arcanobacterium buesumense]QJC21242.1 phage holin family protein [Arcanobacterium buesumense]